MDTSTESVPPPSLAASTVSSKVLTCVPIASFTVIDPEELSITTCHHYFHLRWSRD